MIQYLKAFILLLTLSGVSSVIAWGALSGQAVIEEAKRRTEPSTEVTEAIMELNDGEKTVRKRKMIVYYKAYPKKKVTLLKFTSPANINGVGIIIEEEEDKDNSIWTYMPATRRLRRLSGKQRRNWFMGTEFIYEDFEGFKISRYDFSVPKQLRCGNGLKCFVVEAVANTQAESDSSAYLKKRYWIEANKYFLVKSELYDKEGKLWKVFTADRFRKINGYFRPGIQIMQNLKNGRSTRITEITRKIDVDLEDYYLSRRFLRAD